MYFINTTPLLCFVAGIGVLTPRATGFDMDKFWAVAAKMVKPGGTVALWTCCTSLPMSKFTQY
jgi:hypothetical protein